jgi:hypothetical protein
MQVLLGLTNINETGCRVLGAAGGAIKSMARMAVADPRIVPYPADHRQSFRALGLTLLINLTEHNAKNRAVALEGFVARGPGGGDLLVDTFKVTASLRRLMRFISRCMLGIVPSVGAARLVPRVTTQQCLTVRCRWHGV